MASLSSSLSSNDERAGPDNQAYNVYNTASVPFRREIQRAVRRPTARRSMHSAPVTTGSPADVDAAAAAADNGVRAVVNEDTPLLSGGGNGRETTSSRRGPPVGHHYPQHNHTAHLQRSFARRLLLDKAHTPGYNSPHRAARVAAHVLNVTKATLYSSPVNALLVFVPLGIAAGAGAGGVAWSAATVFTLNFFAIIPLAAVLSFATEEIAVRLGESLGGLLNATFGNAVELIVSIVALRQGQIAVVQSSMLGSILSNLLLVLGMCFFLGGLWNMRGQDNMPMEQSFATVTAQTSCSLMALSMASLIIPAALYNALDNANNEEKRVSILVLSRGTAVILLSLYVLFLFFQLRTHANLFDPEATPSAFINGLLPGDNDGNNHADEDETEQEEEEEEEEEEVHMSPWSAAVVLVVVTVVIAVCAEYLVDTIDAIVASGSMSKNFIGLILLPIVGNAAEHVTACVVATRNKMDLAVGVALGSSIQIALLVTPALVIVGWLVLDQPMTLRFETFETIVFALSVLVVAYTVQDGKSNYLEGAMLMGLYIIIALAFYVSPAGGLDAGSALLALVGLGSSPSP
ncbi:calcium ion transporter [Niveomyces insectorum RCEF 264]|uniref:Calcium ion transporter n=1 Tax=Niveomyces insectorum RCEF 264 TaxID=1081102 RepID=A0A167WUI4_9HYPO|nr:calcium ion transporter [Niveomyces insectorum RCEF 264]